MGKKERLDKILLDRGLFPSREQARTAIMTGRVFAAGKKLDKAGTMLDPDIDISLTGEDMPFVSRGGLKLDKAVHVFGLDFQEKVVLDVGASTGGFTDCALQNGARRVYAVDVGRGQLAWKLRQDERVVVLENTNARYLSEKEIPEPVDAVVMDASFISLEKLLPAALPFLREDGFLLCLIKPQFEAGREKVGRNGVVWEKSTHLEVISRILDFVCALGLVPAGLDYSPVTGPKGNIEYLLWLRRQGEAAELDLPALLDTAFSVLRK